MACEEGCEGEFSPSHPSRLPLWPGVRASSLLDRRRHGEGEAGDGVVTDEAVVAMQVAPAELGPAVEPRDEREADAGGHAEAGGGVDIEVATEAGVVAAQGRVEGAVEGVVGAEAEGVARQLAAALDLHAAVPD